LLKLKEYLVRKKSKIRVLDVFVVIVERVVVLQIFHEIIKNFDVWWALMIKKFNIIRVKFNRNKRLFKKKTRIITQGYIQI